MKIRFNKYQGINLVYIIDSRCGWLTQFGSAIAWSCMYNSEGVVNDINGIMRFSSPFDIKIYRNKIYDIPDFITEEIKQLTADAIYKEKISK